MRLNCRSSSGLGKAVTSLLKGTHKILHALEQRAKAVTSQKPGSDLPADLGGSAGEPWVGGYCGSSWGHKNQWQTYWGKSICVNSPRGGYFACLIRTKTRPHPTICRLQCWGSSGQKTNQAGTQPPTHQLPKDFQSPQPTLNKPLAMGLSTRGPGPSSTHQGADTKARNLQSDWPDTVLGPDSP